MKIRDNAGNSWQLGKRSNIKEEEQEKVEGTTLDSASLFNFRPLNTKVQREPFLSKHEKNLKKITIIILVLIWTLQKVGFPDQRLTCMLL